MRTPHHQGRCNANLETNWDSLLQVVPVPATWQLQPRRGDLIAVMMQGDDILPIRRPARRKRAIGAGKLRNTPGRDANQADVYGLIGAGWTENQGLSIR